MRFDYDAEKSFSNKQKHGIDFQESQLLWDDPNLLLAEARSSDEPRFLAIGLIHGKHWSAIYTVRENAIRLISVRRSRKEEVKQYEG